MNRKLYKVMLNCDSGTIRLINDVSGMHYETIWHTVTWFVTDSIEEARQAVLDHLRYYNPKVRNTWYERILAK